MSERKMTRQYHFLVLSLVLGGMLASCSGESKNVQCQKFIKVNQEVKTSLTANEALSQSLNRRTKNLAEFQQLAKDFSTFFSKSATSLDKAVKLITDLSVQDDKLKTLKTEYLAITTKTGEATRKLATIADAQSKITEKELKDKSSQRLGAEFTKAIKTLGEAGKEEEALITSLNTYCGNKPK
jgi:hypothetical protein